MSHFDDDYPALDPEVARKFEEMSKTWSGVYKSSKVSELSGGFSKAKIDEIFLDMCRRDAYARAQMMGIDGTVCIVLADRLDFVPVDDRHVFGYHPTPGGAPPVYVSPPPGMRVKAPDETSR